MRIYPDLPAARRRALAADLLIIAVLVACLLAGRAVHGAVLELDVLGRGVQRAGTQVQDGFRDAGNRVDSAPVVGDDLDRALTRAGARTGTPVVEAGRRGREAVADLALLLGWVVGGLPALVVLVRWVPGRVTRARRLLDARRVFGQELDDEHRRVLAMRAAFDLPFGELLRYTRDPFGDLAAGRLDGLLTAISSSYGLRIP
ncbi:MAG: hypothetical protein JWM86_1610 [Thermoleophilia bacterium]|nr:hypothetical protein [Thermoleophilia bacterium]